MGDEIPMKIVLKTRAYQITGESYTEVCTAWAKTKGMFDVYADTVITYIGPAEAPTTLAEDVDAKVGRLLAEGLPVERVPKSRELAEVEQTITTLATQIGQLSASEVFHLSRNSQSFNALAWLTSGYVFWPFQQLAAKFSQLARKAEARGDVTSRQTYLEVAAELEARVHAVCCGYTDKLSGNQNGNQVTNRKRASRQHGKASWGIGHVQSSRITVDAS